MKHTNFDIDGIHEIDLALWKLSLCLSDAVSPERILNLINQVADLYGTDPRYLTSYQAVTRAGMVSTH